MYNNLWDQSPIIQKMKATKQIETLQHAVITVVGARFPTLAELAQQRVALINDSEKLDGLLIQISTAPDEAKARALLALTVA